MSKEEEKRAHNRERQRRWRREHKWLGEQRRLATYGMSEAQRKAGFTEEGVTTIEVWIPESGKLERVKVDGRTRSGRLLLALWRQVQATNNAYSGQEPPAAGIMVEGF